MACLRRRVRSGDARVVFTRPSFRGKLTLPRPWETVYFNDREVKHEARGFDGQRPCKRDVLVTGRHKQSDLRVAPR
eukprot:9766410-Alexandrium_andersonii.AAC.1